MAKKAYFSIFELQFFNWAIRKSSRAESSQAKLSWKSFSSSHGFSQLKLITIVYSGSRKLPVLLTFSTVFLLTWWVDESEKVESYADTIYGWSLILIYEVISKSAWENERGWKWCQFHTSYTVVWAKRSSANRKYFAKRIDFHKLHH